VRINRSDDRVILHDCPGGHWALGLFLLAGGLLGVAAPLGLMTDAEKLRPWERTGILVIGVGVASGALWWLRRSPATRIIIDRERRQLRLIRTGIGGRRAQELAFDDLLEVTIERGEDDDGGLITRPILRLKNGAKFPLSVLWSHDEQGVAAAAAEVARECGLPPPTHSDALAPPSVSSKTSGRV
jgi:hypothetical protein